MANVTQKPPDDAPPSGWASPGWTPPGPGRDTPTPPQWGQPPPSPQWGQGPPQWGPPQPGYGWAPPPKPGIVPLRPLGVGELLDGAIGAVRTNPRTVLGLSAVVVVATSLLQFLASWLLVGDAASAASLSDNPGPAEVMEAFGDSVAVFALTAVASWVATTVLGGLLAFAVGRAVIGESPTPGEAWAAVRPVLIRLLLATLLVGVVVAAPLVAAGLVGVAAAAGGLGGGAVAGLVTLALLVAVPTTIWLYVRLALTAPALVLESSGGQRRVGVPDALRRSAALVRGAWWRTFGLLLLVTLLAGVASGAITVPFAIISTLLPQGTPSDPAVLPLVVSSFGSMIGALLATPFTAAAMTLLYVDRRIRREGLDIELARAAGVSIPGRTDAPPAGSW